MSESSKVTLSVEELINLTAHAATQEQLNDTRKELDQKIETVRHEVQDVRNELKADIQDVRNELKADIQDVRNEVGAIKNILLVTAFTIVASVAAGAFYLGSHLPS